MKTHDEMVADRMKDAAFKMAYDAHLRRPFSLFDELFAARQEAGFICAGVAQRMGSKASAVARLPRRVGIRGASVLVGRGNRPVRNGD